MDIHYKCENVSSFVFLLIENQIQENRPFIVKSEQD